MAFLCDICDKKIEYLKILHCCDSCAPELFNIIQALKDGCIIKIMNKKAFTPEEGAKVIFIGGTREMSIIEDKNEVK